MLINLLIFLLFCSVAHAENPPTTLYDEGTKQGVVFNVNCVGAGIACTKSGITGTLTVGGGSGSIGIGTANTITYWDSTSTIGSLNTATYPSLTELSYSKGVTSGIQAQIDGKQASGSYLTAVTADSPLSGSGTSGSHLVLSTAGTWAGTAANVTTNANLTGEVTSVGNAATIADGVTVDNWTMGASAGTTPSAGDNDTSLATTAFVTTALSKSGGGWNDGGTNVFLSTTTDRVGIGTTTPNSLTSFEIVKQGSSSPIMISSVASGGGNYLIMNSVGNVGIGTTGPTRKLTISGTSNFFNIRGTSSSGYVETRMTNDNSAHSLDLGIGGTATGDAFQDAAYVSTNSTIPLFFSTNNTNRLNISSGGSIGIGTTSTDTTNGGLVLMNKNLGIGTINPGQALDIAGGRRMRLVGIGTTVAGTILCLKTDGTVGYCTGVLSTGYTCGTCN